MPTLTMASGLPELDRLAGERPDLAEPLAFYRASQSLLRRYRHAVARMHLAPAAVQQKLEAGCPVLLGEELPVDLYASRALLLRLARIVERLAAASPARTSPPPGKPAGGRGGTGSAAAARAVRQAIGFGHLDLARVYELLIAGDGPGLESTAHGLGLDPDLLRTLALYSLKPAFEAWAEELRKTADFDGWRRGICPVCGSVPVLAEIQGTEGIRYLRCGLCGAGWRYPYLKCACCLDAGHLSLLAVDGDGEKYRIQACAACHGYIKQVTTFDPIPLDLLPIHDLATLHLDIIAAEHGYHRAGVIREATGP